MTQFGVIAFIITQDDIKLSSKIITRDDLIITHGHFDDIFFIWCDYFRITQKNFGESLRVIRNIVHEIFEHNQLMS